MSSETTNVPTMSAINKATPKRKQHTGKLLANELVKYLSEFDFHARLTKRERVIFWLMIAANLKLKVTRFDAEWIGDHCFNSTISEITNIDHIIVDRIPAKRPTGFGTSTDCKEYWLQGQALEAATLHCNRVLTVKSNLKKSKAAKR